MAYLFLTLAFVMNASANVLLKLAATEGFSFNNFTLTAANAYAASAVVLFAANLGFYLLALRTIPLSTAYPVMIAMTFLIITCASLILGEKLGLIQLIGIAAIALGVALISIR